MLLLLQINRNSTIIVATTVSPSLLSLCSLLASFLSALCVDDFKKMYKQKFKEREKAFAQQQKELKNLKAHGKSKAHAVRRGQIEMKI